MNLNHSWVTGFIDGHGNFTAREIRDSEQKIFPEFTIRLQKDDIRILQDLKSYFKCGTVQLSQDGCVCYMVCDLSHLINNIIPFFERHSLKTSKKIDFLRFRWIVRSMVLNEHHKDPEGLKNLVAIIKKMSSAIR